MTGSIDALLSIAGPPLSPRPPDGVGGCEQILQHPIGRELFELLTQRNGCFAFEQALEIYPCDRSGYPNLIDWNAGDGWRGAYEELDTAWIFFAQDAFGVQFATDGTVVASFDPETGEFSPIASSLTGWAESILQDYRVLTGQPLAHDWQMEYGPLQSGHRLIPKMPFVGGGAFAVDNLYALDCAESMFFRAQIANQIRNLPDGATISFKTE